MFVNYVDEVVVVDGVIELMEVVFLEEYELELYFVLVVVIFIVIFIVIIGVFCKVVKDDEIKMWVVFELDVKKKKKKGIFGIGNLFLFFVSELDKVLV